MASLKEELVEQIADKIDARMGPVFGSPEYLADPVKLARAENRRRQSALSHAALALDAIFSHPAMVEVRDALRCAPIPNRMEHMSEFRQRQDKWLAGQYRKALEGITGLISLGEVGNG